MSFFNELRRRNVFKVGAAYGIVAWLLIQAASILFPAFLAPGWVMPVFSIVVILGFPLALVLAWAYELTPEGIRPTADVEPENSVAGATGRKLNHLIIGLLAVALAFVVVDAYLLRPDAGPASAAGPASQASPGDVDSAPAERQPGVLPSSVAVLPFVNLSPNPDDGYFAAGIHEEVVSQLAKIRSLNVIARTSVLRYAGTTRPVPEIAAELRVATVLEGSVRYAGERVRVTAQLIDGATNTHLWTETYDGTVADVFAIQADIAMQIAAALEAELSPAEQASIGKQVTSSTDAYALYLKAIALYYESGGTIFMAPSARTTLQSYLDAAIAIDPDFATAFAWKAWIYSDSIVVEIPTPGGEIASNESRAEQIRINADRALALDETVGLAHAALARLHSAEWRAADALAAGERARQSSPNDPAVLYWSAAMSWLADHYDEAIRHANRGIELDQRNLSLYIVLSYALRASGREEEAAAALRRAIEINPRAEGPYVLLARSEIALSRTESALEALRSADQAAAPAASPNSHLRVDAAYSYARLGNRADVERLLSRFADGAAVERLSPGFRAVADLVRGDYRGAMERVEALVATGVLYADLVPAAFIRHNAWSDPVLEEPEWVALRAQLAFSQ